MDRARILKLLALKQTVELNAYRREAARLAEEMTRLKNRRSQINDLCEGYREHLARPEMLVGEYRDVVQIIGRLIERRNVDDARRDILAVEETRLNGILVQKQRQIEKLEDEAELSRKAEARALQDRLELLTPARR